MSARDEILAAARKAKPPGQKLLDGLGRQALLPPKFVREARDLTQLFLDKLAAASTTYAVLDRAGEIPAYLAGWLKENASPDSALLVSEDETLRRLDWQSAGLAPGGTAPDVLAPATIISGAFAGVAETGSLALLTSGTSRPSHNLLADTHVVVLGRSQIVASFEDVWRMVRAGGLPRAVSFITGASRTADIEMTIELGVHGAVRMHVILVTDGFSTRELSR